MEIKVTLRTHKETLDGETGIIKKFANLDDTDNKWLTEIITKFYEADWLGRARIHTKTLKE